VIVVNNVNDLRKDHLYYALNVNQEIPKRNVMNSLEEFFEKLRVEQELDDDDIVLIEDTFRTQKVKFKQLMETGELAITDGEAERNRYHSIGIREHPVLASYKKQSIKQELILQNKISKLKIS